MLGFSFLIVGFRENGFSFSGARLFSHTMASRRVVCQEDLAMIYPLNGRDDVSSLAQYGIVGDIVRLDDLPPTPAPAPQRGIGSSTCMTALGGSFRVCNLGSLLHRSKLACYIMEAI